LTTEREVFTGPCDAVRKFGAAHTVAFSPPDGRHLAAGSDGAVRVWDWKDGQLLHTFPGHENHSIPVAFSHDGRRLVTGGAFREGQKLWDAEAGGLPLRIFPAHGHPVSALAFSPEDGRLASASFDKSVKVWDTTTGGLLHTLWHTGNVECVALSPDGRTIASAGLGTLVKVRDAQTGRVSVGFSAHTVIVFCLAWQPDGRRIATAGADLPLHTVKVWDARTGREAFALQAGRENLAG